MDNENAYVARVSDDARARPEEKTDRKPERDDSQSQSRDSSTENMEETRGSHSSQESGSGDDKSSGTGVPGAADGGKSGDDSGKSESGDASGGDDSDKNRKGRIKNPPKREGGADIDEDGKKKGKDKQNKSPSKKLKDNMNKAQLAAQAAGAGIKHMMAAKALMIMKYMLQMAMALAQAAAATIASTITAIISGVVAAVQSIAAAIGVSVAVAAGGVIVGGVVAVVVTAAAIGGVRDAFVASQIDEVVECNTDISYMLTNGVFSPQELENGKKIYAFFRAYGYADTQIAGMLGVFSTSTGVDPTFVETINSEPYTTPVSGTQKYEAWQGQYEYFAGHDDDGDEIWITTSPVNFMIWEKYMCEGSEYERGLITYVGSLLSRSTYTAERAKYSADKASGYLAIGLGQWSDSRNTFLRNYAASHSGYEWYDVETQCMFMVDPAGDKAEYVNLLQNWKPMPTAREACIWFGTSYMGETPQEDTITRAEEWYLEISRWHQGTDYDSTWAESLMGTAGVAGLSTEDRAQSQALRSCSGIMLSDNTSAAMAALSYAWPPGANVYNDGTPCWKHIHDTIAVGDGYYRSCDRTVALAMRWSGTDSDYPLGGTYDQTRYLLSSPRWQMIDWGGAMENLLPGDVLIRNDLAMTGISGVYHTGIYVGEDLVCQLYGESYRGTGYVNVSGSLNSRSPGVRKWYSALSTYYVFRNIQKYDSGNGWSSLTCAGV